MPDKKDIKRLAELEQHYRSCACRSTTPFFSEKITPEISPHVRNSKGLIYRTYFQHDRDKILYSRFFRRLKFKAQVFPEHAGDHLRTRLDHTLEVSQIGRHMARQLQLNEDLVDAISLAHDIGHTPFGHSGERALHKFLIKPNNLDGFKHNWQGLRIVDKLEKLYAEKDGLNLTNAVRIGILLHTDTSYRMCIQPCTCDMKSIINFEPENKRYNIFEIQICKMADEIAQVIHDLEDAYISKEIPLEQVIKNKGQYPIIKDCLDAMSERILNERSEKAGRNKAQFFNLYYPSNFLLLITQLRSELIWQLTTDLINSARAKLLDWEDENLKSSKSESKISIFNEFVHSGRPFPEIIDLDKKKEDFKELNRIIQERLVNSERINRMDGKADYILHRILEVYLSKPKQVHQSILDQYSKEIRIKGEEIRKFDEEELKKLSKDPFFIRASVDYVAGMTDRFALREYDQLYSAYPRVEI